MFRVSLAATLVALALTGPTAAATFELTDYGDVQATASSQDWCRDTDRWNDRDEIFCEVRELTAAATGMLDAESRNGSTVVTGSERRDVSVQARVTASAATLDEARDIARQVQVVIEGGRLRATGPAPASRRSWHVSYRAEVPSRYDLTLSSANGSVSVTGVRGTITADTANGSIRMADVGGRVNARTRNGSTHVTLSGSRWDGEGLSVITSNGSARLDLPESFNARLIAGTTNGGINIDFPVTVQGRLGREVDTTLGAGGSTVEVRTTNGSVRVVRR